jgi:hypothetical protein
MNNPNADFQLLPLTTTETQEEVAAKAIKNLKAWHEDGKLEPLPDWSGDTLEGYMDVLGLNGRPIRQNRVNGVRQDSRRP